MRKQAAAGGRRWATAGLVAVAVCGVWVASRGEGGSDRTVFSSGPDLTVGPVFGLDQSGREGPIGSGTVAIGSWTVGCNKGNTPIHWFELPNVDHPVMTNNFYRLRTVDGSDRLEQLGQSWIKHGFGAAQDNACNYGCTPFPGLTQLGVGCSDPYSSFQIAFQCDLAPRSVIHPYTGEMPGGDPLGPGPGGCTQNFPSRNHIGHTHNFGGIEHRTQVQEVDLVPALNPGATYFGEVHYITPHEYTAGNGNQNNNVSHGPFEVQGPDVNGFYQFIEAGATSFESPSVDSWPGAVQTHIEPAQLRDGKAVLAYKATDLGAGQWHYEYAIYNMNLGRGVGSFGVPLPSGVTLSNVGFHAPLNHAPEANAENYTNDPWVAAAGGGMFTWSTDPFAVNPLANAIRWGTLYNFRFDADTPPRSVLATVGMFKTGELLAAVTIGPAPTGPQDCNNNGLDDLCDLDCNLPGCNVPGCGLGIDCNGNAVPDTCELDCNGNGIDDSCDIANQTDTDCNRNNIPDGCETDCDGNGTADTCDISADRTRDCQRNGVLDVCEAPNPQTVGACCHPDLSCSETVPAGCIGADVFQGLCTNCAETLCQPPPPLNPPLAAFPPHDRAKNRYVSFVPNSPGPVAFMIGKVTGTAGAGWVGTPNASGIAGVLPLMPTPRNWPEPVVHVGDCPVVPDADYEIRATMDGITFSPALTVSTTPQPAPKFWGDTVGDFQSLCSVGGTACGPVGSTCNGTGVCGMWTAPNGVVSVNDFLAALQKFQGVVTAPHVTVVDVVGAGQPGQQSCLNRAGNIGDVFNLIKAFQGDAYPFTTDPAACPVCP